MIGNILIKSTLEYSYIQAPDIFEFYYALSKNLNIIHRNFM